MECDKINRKVQDGDKMSDKGKKETISWLKSIAIALVLALLIRQFLFTPVTVLGQSMEPTFENENRIVITKIHSINHFDMIVFHAPEMEDDYIKRVIGIPGDHLVMKDDQLFINGEQYEEQYLAKHKEGIHEGQRLTENFEVTVPEGHYYVLGDNRQHSSDSRVIGFVPEEKIIGKVSFRFFPLKSIGIPK